MNILKSAILGMLLASALPALAADGIRKEAIQFAKGDPSLLISTIRRNISSAAGIWLRRNSAVDPGTWRDMPSTLHGLSQSAKLMPKSKRPTA